MKKIILNTTVLLIAILVVSCTQNHKLPPPVGSVEQAKTLLKGKVWQVVDVATISGSRKSVFDDDKPKNETIVAPAIETLNWLGTKKGKDISDFTASFLKKNLEISIALNKDSIATIKGMDATKQTFTISNESDESEPKGIKLLLTQKNEDASIMGVDMFTATYFILGANENTLYLLTPNKLNDLKVVYLLESK